LLQEAQNWTNASLELSLIAIVNAFHHLIST
jgi:hypothetical protein